MYDAEPGELADDRNEGQTGYTYNACGGPTDKREKCPDCNNKTLCANRHKITQRVRDLFREIDRFVTKGG
jgi:hypothetical protein